MKIKTCSKCGLVKGVDQFCKEPRNKDGLHSYCKKCSGIIRENCRRKNRERNAEIKPDITEKLCLKCGKLKSINQFHKSLGSKDGWAENCKECRLNTTRNLRQRYKTNNQNIDYSKEKNLRCSGCGELKSSLLFYKYRSNKTGFQDICKECTKSSRRQHKYGITPKALCSLVKQQENKCAVCGVVFTTEFHIDHSHITNLVRGLLCEKCNLAIGLLKDSPTVLRSAATYLEQSSGKKPHVA